MGAASRRFPEFIIIGAIKAATTWVAHQLRQNPALFLPGPEPHFFSTEYHRGHDWYASLFAKATPDQIVGEKSADYLSYPLAAGRIAQALPSARLIVLLRNPIERAYSDYCMLYRRGVVDAKPERYLSGSDAENGRFLQSGLYAQHLSRYLDHFPREQVCTILHEDVLRDPKAVVAQACAHIGVSVMIEPSELVARKNDSETPILPLPVRRFARPFKEIVKPVRDHHWFEALRRTLARPIRYPPMSNDLRQRLSDYYLSDIRALEQMLGRDMTSWLRADNQFTKQT